MAYAMVGGLGSFRQQNIWVCKGHTSTYVLVRIDSSGRNVTHMGREAPEYHARKYRPCELVYIVPRPRVGTNNIFSMGFCMLRSLGQF